MGSSVDSLCLGNHCCLTHLILADCFDFTSEVFQRCVSVQSEATLHQTALHFSCHSNLCDQHRHLYTWLCLRKVGMFFFFYDFENVSGTSFSQPQGWMYILVITEALYEVDTLLDITADICIFMLSQLIIFGCSVWMIHALKLSSTVRTKKIKSESKTLTLAHTRSQLCKWTF